MSHKKHKHKQEWQVAYWATFLGLALVVGMKIVEFTAEERLRLMVMNSKLPYCIQGSYSYNSN